MLHVECWNDANCVKVEACYTYFIVIIILLLYLYHTCMLSFISIHWGMWWLTPCVLLCVHYYRLLWGWRHVSFFSQIFTSLYLVILINWVVNIVLNISLMKHRAEAIKKASGVMFPEEVMSDFFFSLQKL